MSVLLSLAGNPRASPPEVFIAGQARELVQYIVLCTNEAQLCCDFHNYLSLLHHRLLIMRADTKKGRPQKLVCTRFARL